MQAETIWSLLGEGKKAPRADFDEGWRYILLGSEHTWCFENPTEPYFQDAIWKVKQSYFHEAENRSIDMLAESLAPITDKSNGALGPKEGPSNGGIAVINTHTWPHTGIITLSEAESLKGNRSHRIYQRAIFICGKPGESIGSLIFYIIIAGFLIDKTDYITGCRIYPKL